ncbi:MAG: pilus assembly protein, partial [Mesorhizobium sp.]
MRQLRTKLRLIGEESGTSAVEFALLSPVFILLLLGMVAYGIYFGASNSLQQIAADAARTAIAGLNQTERQALVASFVKNNASGYPFVD